MQNTSLFTLGKAIEQHYIYTQTHLNFSKASSLYRLCQDKDLFFRGNLSFDTVFHFIGLGYSLLENLGTVSLSFHKKTSLSQAFSLEIFSVY